MTQSIFRNILWFLIGTIDYSILEMLINRCEAIVSDHAYRFLVHDRDSIYAQALDMSIAKPGAPSAENTSTGR
jgi:hypothetical protein